MSRKLLDDLDVGDGCDYHPHCLTCPLPRCRYDAPGGLRQVLNEARDAEVHRLRAEGLKIREIAARVGLSPRSVMRILKLHKEADDAPQ